MTSSRDMKAGSVLQQQQSSSEDNNRRRVIGAGGPSLDQLPPPANSNKPLTPFSIEDILNKPSVKKSSSSSCIAPISTGVSSSQCPPSRVPLHHQEKVTGSGVVRINGITSPSSPLCALEELASKTFKGLEVSVIQAAEGREHVNAFGQRQTSKKRRKSRTAFTNHQIYELEKRFLYQKYLSPADRDQIAQQLGLTNAQVITWFQNRRAKLKRDLEEMKADVESLKKIPPQTLEKLVSMDDEEEEEEEDDINNEDDPLQQGGGGGGGESSSGGAISPSISPPSSVHGGVRGGHHQHHQHHHQHQHHHHHHGAFPQSPSSSRDQTTDEFSEEDEEIEVDD